MRLGRVLLVHEIGGVLLSRRRQHQLEFDRFGGGGGELRVRSVYVGGARGDGLAGHKARCTEQKDTRQEQSRLDIQ